MTDFPALTDATRHRPDLFLPYPGRAASMGYPPAQPPATFDFRNVEALAIENDQSGAKTAGPGPSFPAPPETDRGALSGEDMSIGGMWFEKVHVLPRTRPLPTFGPIDFGNIITTVQRTFELFSAFRTRTVTLSTFTNNADAGVEVPDLPSIPHEQGPFTSILDPASTRLSPLPLVVQATPDGPATINGPLDFLYTLEAGTRQLFLIGNRIAVVIVQPSGNNSGTATGGFDEILEFGTDIQPVGGGKEKRDSYREFPRQILDWTFSTSELDRQCLQHLLFDWQSRIFAVPIRFEQVRLTAAITGGTTDVALTDDLTFVDMRVGQLAIVLKDKKTFDVLTVISKTASSVTFESDIQESYDVGDLVMPIRLALAQQSIGAGRFPVTVEEFNIRFRVIDNHTGAPTPSTAAFNSYLGKVLLDDCNLLQGNLSERYERRLFIFDNGSGLVQQDSPWSHGKRLSQKGFRVASRRQLYELRQLLLALRGRQISWWIPSFIEDLTPTQDLAISTSVMDVENVGYTRFVQSREPKKTFRITFTDGTSLIRIVQSSVEISADEERLTLDTTWPAARTVSEIQRVEFLELSRFDSDSIRIRHQTTIGRAQVRVPVRTVNDQD